MWTIKGMRERRGTPQNLPKNLLSKECMQKGIIYEKGWKGLAFSTNFSVLQYTHSQGYSGSAIIDSGVTMAGQLLLWCGCHCAGAWRHTSHPMPFRVAFQQYRIAPWKNYEHRHILKQIQKHLAKITLFKIIIITIIIDNNNEFTCSTCLIIFKYLF